MLSFLSILGGGIVNVGKNVLGNPALLALILLAAAFAGVTISKNAEISTLQKDINDPKTGWIARYTAEQRNNDTLRNNATTLTNTLATQSASINAIASQGKATDARFEQILASQATTRAVVAQQIAALDVAKPGVDKCASASALVRSVTQ